MKNILFVSLLLAASGCSTTDTPTDVNGGSGGRGGKGGAGGGKGGSGGGGGSGGNAAGGAMGGSGGAASDAGGDGGAAIQLKMTWWGSPDRAMRTQQVIAMFEAKNPDIKISTEYWQPTQEGGVGKAYWPTLLSYQAAKTLPDIMQHDYAYIEEWTKRGDLRELDDFLADKTLDLSDVPQALIDGGKVDGKVMGISLGLNTQVMAIDTDLFAQHNIALPNDEWTWEDFERIVLELKTKTGRFGAGGGLHNYTPGWKAVYLSSGKWVFSADGKSLGYTDDVPWANHFSMLLRLQDQGAIPQLHQEPKGGNINTDLVVTKQAGLTWLFSNQLVGLSTAATAANGGVERTFKLLPLPRVKGGISPVYLKPSQYFSVTATSKHPKQAAKLIEFFTNDLEANKVLAGERGVPVNSKVLQALKPSLSKAAVESFALIERATSYAQPTPPNDPPGWTTVLTQILEPRTIPGIMYKSWTPAEGTAYFRQQANQVLMGGMVPDGGAPDLPAIPGPGVDGGVDTATDATPVGRALFVVGVGAELGPADLQIRARLEALNLAVDVVADAASTGAMASGKAVVVISASVDSAGVGGKFADVAVPVILLEPNLFDEMGYTGAAAADQGTVAAQTQVTIAAPGNALAAALTGNVTVYSAASRVVFGVPAPAAVKVATVVGNANQSTIFAYASGAMMVGRTASAKRMAFFLHDTLPAPTLTPEGSKLFDAAITWSITP